MKRKIIALILAVITVFVCFIPTSAATKTASQKNCKHKETTQVIVKAKATKKGSVTTKCKKCGKELKQSTIKAPVLTLSDTVRTYNGKTIKPTVKVTSGKKTISSKYYTVTYGKGFKKIGRYNVTVKFKKSCANYSGTIKAVFTIRPQAPTMKNWDHLDGTGFGLHWDCLKDETGIAGYQIQWADNSSFKKANSWIVDYGIIGVHKSNMGLKKGKTYYCRMRSITVLENGDYIYSKWSNVEHDKYIYNTQGDWQGSDTILTVNKGDKAENNDNGKSSNNKTTTVAVPTTRFQTICSTCGGSGRQFVPIWQGINPMTGAAQYTMGYQTCPSCLGKGYR